MRSRSLIKLGGIELSVSVNDHLAAKLGRFKRRFTGAPEPTAAVRNVESNKPESPTPEQQELYDLIDPIEWYHTIDLGHGVVTPGFFDHRPLLQHYHLPASMEGKRVLDVATFDGFWAREFERRGAAEVVAIDLAQFGDIDLAPSVRASMSEEQLQAPLGDGFRLVSKILGSKVKREVISVYDLSPEKIGSFDFVFCGDLLIHLQNPVRALQRICSVTRGTAHFTELFDPTLQRNGPYQLINYHGAKNDHIWWNFGVDTFGQMISDAGYKSVEELDRFDLVPRGQNWSPPHVIYRASNDQ